KRVGMVLTKRRAPARGLSLIEIMVVIVIMGLISAGVAAAVMSHWDEVRKRTTETNARSLRQIAVGWRLTHDGCPTATVLLEDHAIDEASRLRDAWGTAFEIRCDSERTIVCSLGPDRTMDTSDDIVIPPPHAAAH